MYLQRNVFNTKPGCLDAAVALVKGEVESSCANAIIITHYLSPIEEGVLELKFSTLNEYERFWQNWIASPGAEPFIQNFIRIETGLMRELWEVQEPRASPRTGKMINRRVFKIRPGMMQEAISLLKSIREPDQRFEMYTSVFGEDNLLALHFDFDTLDEYEIGWKDFESDPNTIKSYETWNQIIERGVRNEIYQVQ